jgi:hypothetical protein
MNLCSGDTKMGNTATCLESSFVAPYGVTNSIDLDVLSTTTDKILFLNIERI